MNELSDFKSFLLDLFRPIIDESIQAAIDEMKPSHAEVTDEGFMNADQAADYLHLSVHTLYGLTSRKQVPFHKHGKRLLFRKSELEGWVSDTRVNTKDELQQKALDRMRKKRHSTN